MKWITLSNTPLHKMGMAWLITRFVDHQAQIIFVSEAEVDQQFQKGSGIPFNIDGVEFSDHAQRSGFDQFLFSYRFTNAALHKMGKVVSGFETSENLADALKVAGQSALIVELQTPAKDDTARLAQALKILDALYNWCKSEVLSQKVVPMLDINKIL